MLLQSYAAQTGCCLLPNIGLYAEVCDDDEQEDKHTTQSTVMKTTYNVIRVKRDFFIVKGITTARQHSKCQKRRVVVRVYPPSRRCHVQQNNH